jgi:hypothetical protein
MKKNENQYRPEKSGQSPSAISERASSQKSGAVKTTQDKQWDWSDEHLKKFHSAIELYKDHQLGNKKIAKYMGDLTNTTIDAAQIRFEKLRYQKQKRKEERKQTIQRIEDAQHTLKDINWAVVEK